MTRGLPIRGRDVEREGRAEIALRTEELIQQTLDDYGTGIRVTKVNLQDVNFPDQVDAAVQDAIKAREDRERLAFEAQAYANDILPKARGEAARREADAEAYKARVTADAQGEAARFEALRALPTREWEDLLYPMLARLCGVTVARANDELSFGHLDAATAALLDLPEGAPAIRVDRQAFDLGGHCIELRTTWGDATAFHYSAEMR